MDSRGDAMPGDKLTTALRELEDMLDPLNGTGDDLVLDTRMPGRLAAIEGMMVTLLQRRWPGEREKEYKGKLGRLREKIDRIRQKLNPISQVAIDQRNQMRDLFEGHLKDIQRTRISGRREFMKGAASVIGIYAVAKGVGKAAEIITRDSDEDILLENFNVIDVNGRVLKLQLELPGKTYLAANKDYELYVYNANDTSENSVVRIDAASKQGVIENDDFMPKGGQVHVKLVTHNGTVHKKLSETITGLTIEPVH